MDLNLLQNKLNSPSISSKHLLSNCTVLNEKYRNSLIYTDFRHYPFYYHIGKISGAKSICNLNYDLCLEDICFVQGAKTCSWCGVNPIKNNIAQSNIKKFCKDVKFYQTCEELCSESKDFEAFILNDFSKIDIFKEYIWKNLVHEGLLIIDNINLNSETMDKIKDFARSVSRTPFFYKTRYGIIIIER